MLKRQETIIVSSVAKSLPPYPGTIILFKQGHIAGRHTCSESALSLSVLRTCGGHKLRTGLATIILILIMVMKNSCQDHHHYILVPTPFQVFSTDKVSHGQPFCETIASCYQLPSSGCMGNLTTTRSYPCQLSQLSQSPVSGEQSSTGSLFVPEKSGSASSQDLLQTTPSTPDQLESSQLDQESVILPCEQLSRATPAPNKILNTSTPHYSKCLHPVSLFPFGSAGQYYGT